MMMASPMTLLPGQARNHAGGAAYVVDDLTMLQRFLVLGSEGSTYYAKSHPAEKQSFEALARLLDAGRGAEVLELVLAVSEGGRAAKQTSTLTVLALLCHGKGVDAATRAAAFKAFGRICRTGTHLFELIGLCEAVAGGSLALRAGDAEAGAGSSGWGRAHRRAVQAWYNDKSATGLAYQLTKYPGRTVGDQKWTHLDLLRLAHPKPASAAHSLCFRYAAKGADALEAAEDGKESAVRGYLGAVLRLKALGADDSDEAVALIRTHGFVREHVPAALLSSVPVWAALLEKMPLMACVRNLAKMTSMGLIAEGSAAAARVCAMLADGEALRRARVHPFALLLAHKVYAQGCGDKGSLTWTPVGSVVKALEGAFTLAFKVLEPTGKRYLLALDVSGSMGWSSCVGSDLITCREASAAMATVLVNTEPHCESMAFGHEFEPLDIRRGHSLDDVMRRTEGLPFGGTDCALPMLWAAEQRKAFDVFVVFTDSETWAGHVQPVEALRAYRALGLAPDAKLIVCGMAQNEFTIADPSDPGMLDVAGFDAAAPSIMGAFAKGEL